MQADLGPDKYLSDKDFQCLIKLLPSCLVSTSPSVTLDADGRFTMFSCGWVALKTLSRVENGEVEWISLQTGSAQGYSHRPLAI